VKRTIRLTRSFASRLFGTLIYLAPKAQHSSQAWSVTPGFLVYKTLALKARIISSGIEARFQRWFYTAI